MWRLQHRAYGNFGPRQRVAHQVIRSRKKCTRLVPLVHFQAKGLSRLRLPVTVDGIKGHTIARCKVKREVVCRHCGKRGHLRRACKSKSKPDLPKSKDGTRTVGRLQDEKGEQQSSDDSDDPICHVKSGSALDASPITVKVTLDDCMVDMEVDTSSSLSLMSESTFRGLWPGSSLQPSQVRLQTYLLWWGVAVSTWSTMDRLVSYH